MDNNHASEYKALQITRTFNAPRALVWEMWTQPEHFAQWYAPDCFTIPTCVLDVRPEGKLQVDMRGPDGTMYPSNGEYKEVVEPERLVFTNSPLDSSGNKLFEVLHTLTLSEDNDKTTLHLLSEVVSAGLEAAPYLAGMEPGLKQAFVKLEHLIERSM